MDGNVSFLHLQSPKYCSQFSFNYVDEVSCVDPWLLTPAPTVVCKYSTLSMKVCIGGKRIMSASTLIIYKGGRRKREQCISYSSGTWLLFNTCHMVYSFPWDGFLSKTEFFSHAWSDVTYQIWHGSRPASPASELLMVQLRRLSTAILQNHQSIEVVLA